MTIRLRHRALVLTQDGVWSEDGQVHAYVPAGLLTGDLGYLLDVLADGIDREGTVMLGVAAEAVYHPRAGSQALARGWRYAGADTDVPMALDRGRVPLAPWTTFTRAGSPTLHIGCLPSIDYTRTPIFDADTPPQEIARRLAAYYRMVGACWRATAGVAGCAAIRGGFAGRFQPLWHHPRMGDDTPRGVGNLIWEREPTELELALGFVQGWDLNGAYLAAMGTCELSYPALVHTGTLVTFDPSDPTQGGYWRIRYAPDMWPYPACPPPIDADWIEGGEVWVTTPIMRLLYDVGARPEVVDSWTAPRGRTRRILRPVAERWRAARLGMTAGQSAECAAALKATWAETVGMFNRDGGSIFRPDWYDTIVDLARANLIYKIIKIGTQDQRWGVDWPIEVATDAVYYPAASIERQELAGMPIGAGLGQFKPDESMTMDEWMSDAIESMSEDIDIIARLTDPATLARRRAQEAAR